ncbi:putative quinol monooxygenase [Clostridium ljungdahlii]|uniref:Putative monooxygenase YcnE n=1 Tax=Clostridium ljungdahlii TaxID=1538 RepID=A0A168QLI5_9CLOT|nr:putative quinol monooxygenase [Clostridium ljungdahlii]OAA89308.1 putative monooxygenase YcnE [Clostridium ljungdahlii]
MLKVVAKACVKAGEIEKFKKLSSELITESLKEEANIAYNLYEDISDKQILTFIEEWKDEDGLTRHMKSPHFVRIMAELAKIQEKDMDINVYTNCF